MDLPKTPSLRLDGKRALVTGAGRGIGLAAAAALAQAGAHVVLAARTAAEIEAAAAQMREDGGSAESIALDVTDLAAVRKAIDTQAPFDVLVNNAGTNRPAAFLEVTEQDYDAITTLNQRAAFFVAQAVARRMVEADSEALKWWNEGGGRAGVGQARGDPRPKPGDQAGALKRRK